MEIEIRILNIDIEKIRNRIFEIGGVLVKKENQINKLFDFEDGKLLKENSYARIRVIDDLIEGRKIFFMTTKKRIEGDKKFKVMDENEVIISSDDIGEKIFESLGMVMTHKIKKYRESYKVRNVLIEIDINDKNFYPHPYIEIEGENIDEIQEIVYSLGYKMEDTTSKSIFEIIRESGAFEQSL